MAQIQQELRKIQESGELSGLMIRPESPLLVVQVHQKRALKKSLENSLIRVYIFHSQITPQGD